MEAKKKAPIDVEKVMSASTDGALLVEVDLCSIVLGCMVDDASSLGKLVNSGNNSIVS